MGKHKRGEYTRIRILDQAGALFNSRGYFASSLSEIMAATGLEKGAIYNHFGSKEELMLQAFHHAVKQAGQNIRTQVEGVQGYANKLIAFFESFRMLYDDPPVPGGCPLLNAAIESDDAFPALKEAVRQSMDRLLQFVESLIAGGVKTGEFRPDIQAGQMAVSFVASLEGALMVTKLYESRLYLDVIVEQNILTVRSWC